MNSIEKKIEVLEELLNEIKELRNHYREKESEADELLNKIRKEFDKDKDKLEKEYIQFLYILKELVFLSNCENSIQYKTKVSRGKIVSDIKYSYNFIDSDNTMLPYEFINMCKKYEVIEGKSRDHYKPVNYDGKVSRSYVFNTDKINELLEEMNM